MEAADFGNNPIPLSLEGRCCNECNSKMVVPARIALTCKEDLICIIGPKERRSLTYCKKRELTIQELLALFSGKAEPEACVLKRFNSIKTIVITGQEKYMADDYVVVFRENGVVF
jgi:hypothetical protein